MSTTLKSLKICFSLLVLFSLNLNAQRPKGNRPQGPGSTQEIILKGQVLDSQSGQGLEFATISLFSKKDSSLVTGGLTELDGFFTLKVKPGIYYGKAEFISYASLDLDEIIVSPEKPFMNIGQIKLSQSSMLLDDVEIVGERSETTFALDKKVFTVGKDLANRGGSAEDVLDNVPSVTVDIEGAVSLRGSEGVRILIDGRPSGLAGVGNTNGLRNIPSNLIEKVEVITNPSARYEAEGMAGIINIVLKKNDKGGFNASFDLSTGYPYRLGAAANLNYRKGKLNWFINYGITDRENPGGGNRIQDQLLTDSLSGDSRLLSIQNRDQLRTGLSNSFRFGLDYFLTEKEQITGALLYRTSDENNFTEINYLDYQGLELENNSSPLWESTLEDVSKLSYEDYYNSLNNITPTESLLRTDKEREDEVNKELSLNYRKEMSSRDHFLNANIQYRDKSETESSEYGQTSEINTAAPSLFQRSNNAEGENTWLFQLDFSRAISKDHKYEIGIRSSLREIRNDFIVEESTDNFSWRELGQWTNDFSYDEDIHAIYAIYGNTIKKFSYQAGLRTEYSDIKTRLLKSENGGLNARRYTNLFPSGHINYNFSEKSAAQLSYSRRVRRPRFWDLNPFFTFSDNRNFFSGNPNLNPEFTDSYELGQIQYWEDLSLSSSIFYRKTDQSIQRVLTLERSEINTLRMPVNMGTVQDIGLDISASYSGIKWLRLDANCNIFRNQLSLDAQEVKNAVYDTYVAVRNYKGSINDFENEYSLSFLETDNITWTGRFTSRFSFWDSDLQLRVNYRGARESAQGRRDGIGSVNIGWSKDLLNKKMTVTLSVSDLFNSRKRQGVTFFDDFVDKSEFQWRARTSTLTISYRINQKKKRQRKGGSWEGEGGGEF